MRSCRKNFGFRHKSGIWMPVSSLPSEHGIGTFGPAAYAFLDFLAATGQTCWQVLPLNPTSYGDSPYQSPASAAGNPYLIDLSLLQRDGLLTEAELAPHRNAAERIDYGRLFQTRFAILRLAHGRFRPDRAYRKFLADNADWLDDYALFMALKEQYGYRPWTEWPKEHRDYAAARTDRGAFAEQMEFWRWVQFAFHTQWQALRRHAHRRGIRIIGDLPIYVAHDSMDVWAAPQQFQLYKDGTPIAVAGCPPDGFSPDGQLWGNPLYDWETMRRDGFRWWLDRIGAAFRLYDILRIDHFRGFAGYYRIPSGETTARNGTWEKAEGAALFEAVHRRFPKAKIIAEDLGFITEDVLELLAQTGFPGMKMLHFAFYDEDSDNLPRRFSTENCVAYVSSHDSDCTKSWLAGLSGKALERFDAECPRDPSRSRIEDFIAFAMRSKAALVMTSLQDHLELTNEEGRINTPALASGNWSWRVPKDYDTEELRDRIRTLTAEGGRRNRRSF